MLALALAFLAFGDAHQRPLGGLPIEHKAVVAAAAAAEGQSVLQQKGGKLHWNITSDRVHREVPNPLLGKLMSCWSGLAALKEDVNENWWMTGGTLLGQTREASFLPWDHDMDFAFNLQYSTKLWEIMRLSNSAHDTDVVDAVEKEVGVMKGFPKTTKRGKFCNNDGVKGGVKADTGLAFLPKSLRGSDRLKSALSGCAAFCFDQHVYRAAGHMGYKVTFKGWHLADFYPASVGEGPDGGKVVTEHSGTTSKFLNVFSVPQAAVFPTRACEISSRAARCPAQNEVVLNKRYGEGKWEVAPYSHYDHQAQHWVKREGLGVSTLAELREESGRPRDQSLLKKRRNWVITKDKVDEEKAPAIFKDLANCWRQIARLAGPQVEDHYWVTAGTLLGQTRGGDFLPWDHDMDFAFNAEHYSEMWKAMRFANQQPKRPAVETLSKLGEKARAKAVGMEQGSGVYLSERAVFSTYKPPFVYMDQACPRMADEALESMLKRASDLKQGEGVPKSCEQFCFRQHFYSAGGYWGFKASSAANNEFADFFPTVPERAEPSEGMPEGAILKMTQHAGSGPATKAVYTTEATKIYPTRFCRIGGVGTRCPADAAGILDQRYGVGKWRVSPYTHYDKVAKKWVKREGFDDSAPPQADNIPAISAEELAQENDPHPSWHYKFDWHVPLDKNTVTAEPRGAWPFKPTLWSEKPASREECAAASSHHRPWKEKCVEREPFRTHCKWVPAASATQPSDGHHHEKGECVPA